MVILQAYQSDLLWEMDKGEVLVPEVVVELHWVIDLALYDTKHTASAIRYLMAAMIVMERLNQWLNQILYHIWEPVVFTSCSWPHLASTVRSKRWVWLLEHPPSQR